MHVRFVANVNACGLGERGEFVIDDVHVASDSVFEEAVVDDNNGVKEDVCHILHFECVEDILFFAEIHFPDSRHSVPPESEFFFFIQFGGVDACYFKVFFKGVNIYLDVTF